MTFDRFSLSPIVIKCSMQCAQCTYNKKSSTWMPISYRSDLFCWQIDGNRCKNSKERPKKCLTLSFIFLYWFGLATFNGIGTQITFQYLWIDRAPPPHHNVGYCLLFIVRMPINACELCARLCVYWNDLQVTCEILWVLDFKSLYISICFQFLMNDFKTFSIKWIIHIKWKILPFNERSGRISSINIKNSCVI